MVRRTAFLTAAALAWALGLVAPAAADAAVDNFVGRVNATIGSLAVGDRAGARTACTRLVSQAFDLDGMAPVTSAGTWAKMSATQKKAYRTALSRRAAGDCAERSHDFAGQTMALVGVREAEGGDRYVAVKGAKGRTLIWQVRQSGGRLRAVDISVNGRSLALNAKKDAEAVLKKNGGDIDALIRAVAG